MTIVQPNRWTFTVATPAGDIHATYQLSGETLDFESDAVWDGGRKSMPWSSIVEAGSSTLDMPIGPGAPDLGRYVPQKLEWLIASRANAAGAPFMGQLPPAPDRDSLIAAVRERLGARWIGEGIPFDEARRRFQVRSGGENLKAAGIVVGVLVLLFLLLLLLVQLLRPIFLIPAGLALGVWLFRSGLSGIRDAATVANTQTTRLASAGRGLVALEGAASTAHPSPSAATGRPSVWWDLAVDAWSSTSDGGDWHRLATRHGGTKDTLHVEDHTGRVLVWLKDANFVLAADVWETGKDRLPSQGLGLLEDLGFPWNSGTQLRVRETRLEAGAPVYVLGTLGERRSIPEPGTVGTWPQIVAQFRTGQWRATLIRMLPGWLGRLVAVLFGFLSILLGVGRGGERPRNAESNPPDLPANALLVWKGLADRPFVVSNRRDTEAVSQLRTSSLYRCGAGVVVVFYVGYELLNLL